MSPDLPLTGLCSASHSILSQLVSSANPFPPPPHQSLHAKLRHARQTNKQLRTLLEHTLDLTAARRAGLDKGKSVPDQNAPAQQEEDKVNKRIDKLRREVAGLRGSKLVYERVNASLDQALLVVGHMLGDAGDEHQIALGQRLAKRDALALKLLEHTNASRAVQAERAEAGRETRLLTRESAGFARELREAESDKKAVAAMTDAQRLQHDAAKEAGATNLQRLTIVHQVFALLVAEAGIEWCFPELLEHLGEVGVAGEEGEGMTDRRLMKLMVTPVEEIVGDKEEVELGSIGNKKRKAAD